MQTENCKILKLNWKTQKRIIDSWIETCDNSKFDDIDKCTLLSVYEKDERPSYIYLAIDPKNKFVVGGIAIKFLKNKERKIDGVWMSYITTRSYKDPENYKGLGSKLLGAVIKDATDRPKINFIYISSWSNAGLGLYLKFGFKLIGTTGILILQIREMPTINRIRYLYRISPEKYRKYNRKLFFSKKQDNIDRWRKLYCTYPDFEEYNFLRFKIDKSNFFLYNEQDLNSVELYPKWMYKYSRKI